VIWQSFVRETWSYYILDWVVSYAGNTPFTQLSYMILLIIILSQLVGMIDFVHQRVGSAWLDSWDIVCKSHDFRYAVRHDTALKIFLAGELPVSLWWITISRFLKHMGLFAKKSR